MKYPDTLTTKKTKIAYWIFRNNYIFEAGKGKVLGRWTGWFAELSIFYLLFDKLGIVPTNKMLAVIIITALISCYILGLFYLRYDLDSIETLVCEERQPMIREIYDKIVKGKENRWNYK